MHTRITDFITKHKILSDNQYGFRAQRSTYMALLQLMDRVTYELDNKQYSIGIFLDLSKAFDTNNHIYQRPLILIIIVFFWINLNVIALEVFHYNGQKVI